MKLLSGICVSILLALMSFSSLYANDLIVQKVILKNGSIYEGYIVSQRIGSQNIVFKSFCSTINIPRTKYKNVTISNKDVEISKLSDDWRLWAKENDAVKKDGVREVVQLSTVIADNTEINDVYIKKMGDEIKYVSMKEQNIRLSLDSITEIIVPERPKACLSGVNRVYELVNGNRIQGEYRGEIYSGRNGNKKVKLQTEDGFVELNKADIVKCIFKPYNKDQNIFEQTPLIDIVRTKGGNTYEGVITEHNFADEGNGGAFITLMQNSGAMKMISYEDILEFGREGNYKYRPTLDVILKKGEFILNDSSLVFKNLQTPIITSTANDNNSICKIYGDSLNTRIYKNVDKISLSLHNNTGVINEQFVMYKIEKLNAKNDKEIKKKKKNDKDFDKTECYTIDLVDFFTKQILPVKISGPTKNGTVKYDFKVNDPGDYLLFDFLKLNYVILKIQ